MIAERLKEVLDSLPAGVRLVAVSKFHPEEAIMEAYRAGQRVFGESRVQELTAKHEDLPRDIEWHFIGHLQTNKVRQIASYVALIHGVDSYHLLEEISRQGERVGREVPCLLQLHIAREETKFGFSFEECRQMLATGAWRNLHGVRICGLMGMASFTDDQGQVSREMQSLADFFHEVKAKWFADDDAFRELSMGMSDDYPLAVAAGSTMVRVGSRIFGARDYGNGA